MLISNGMSFSLRFARAICFENDAKIDNSAWKNILNLHVLQMQ